MGKAETVRTGKLGKIDLHLARKGDRYYGLANRIVRAEGDDANDVWRRLHDEVGRASPSYFGFEGARARFLRFFPGGFHSDRYQKWERDYKDRVKNKLNETVPLERALREPGLGEDVLPVFHVNLLSQFEQISVRDALKGPRADDFVRGAARFATGELKTGLAQMDHALKPHNAAKWTVATYLPFLWRPEDHMFLKPEATKDFSERVGHPLVHQYEAQLTPGVYDALLDLAAKTEREIAELKPRDRIDVQSFIWVVGAYTDSELPQD